MNSSTVGTLPREEKNGATAQVYEEAKVRGLENDRNESKVASERYCEVNLPAKEESKCQ